MFGFKTAIKTVEGTSGSTISIRFTLRQEIRPLETVVIRAESEKENSAEAIDVIETREVKLRSADLGEVMAKTEGISVQRAGGLGSNTRFALNGLSNDQIRFFYDDIPLNFTPYVFGIANVPINAVNRIEVYKGVVPIQFGADALGGAVNLVPPTIYEGFSGSLSYQYGSFNTHRVTTHLSYANDSSSWFINTGGFFDHTDNNNKIDVAIPNDLGKFQSGTVERFHDDYHAYGMHIKTGIRQKSWANILSIDGYLGDYNNEAQNSQSQGLIDSLPLVFNKVLAGNPFGEALFTSQSRGVNLQYQVDLGGSKLVNTEALRGRKGWVLNFKAGYNFTERVSRDTSRNLYNWRGEIERIQIPAGEFEEDDHLITKSENYFLRQQIGYQIVPNHQIKLTIAPTYNYRTGHDLLIDGKFDEALDDRYLFDIVTSLEYRGDWLKEKLQIIVFTKNYRQNIRIESLDPSISETIMDERLVSNCGTGTGIRCTLRPRITTKLSYEYAYRLPRQDEIFGDGQLIQNNQELRPENSHNVNLQGIYNNKADSRVAWDVQIDLFLRRINDLIFLVVNQEDFGAFQNVWSANSQGIELSGRVEDVIKRLAIHANNTYQSYFNTSDDGPFASFKGDRIPNTPYFFSSGGAIYELDDKLLKQKGDLAFFWNVHYIHSFFIGWESAGLQQFKAQVSNQTTHAGGITYHLKTNGFQIAITVESQNLTNAKVFDLYGRQRYRRAFYIKLTTQF